MSNLSQFRNKENCHIIMYLFSIILHINIISKSQFIMSILHEISCYKRYISEKKNYFVSLCSRIIKKIVEYCGLDLHCKLLPYN
jgi:hypothetical protein